MAQKKRDNNKSDSRGSKKGKFDMNPFNFIEEGKNKLENFYKKLQKDKSDLSKRLGKHDIGNLAENKPGLVEKIINGASKKALRCVEIASGSPLTEEELNGKPNKECPSFWPATGTN